MRYLLLTLITFFMIPLSVKANTQPDFDSFGAWPVLHDGRVKS